MLCLTMSMRKSNLPIPQWRCNGNETERQRERGRVTYIQKETKREMGQRRGGRVAVGEEQRPKDRKIDRQKQGQRDRGEGSLKSEQLRNGWQ